MALKRAVWVCFKLDLQAFEDSVEQKKSAMQKGARAFKDGLGGKTKTRTSSVWSGVSYGTC